MQYQFGGDVPRDGQTLVLAEHFFKSKDDAMEFVKTEVCLSMCGEECIYFVGTDRWLVLSLNLPKDAVAAGA